MKKRILLLVYFIPPLFLIPVIPQRGSQNPTLFHDFTLWISFFLLAIFPLFDLSLERLRKELKVEVFVSLLEVSTLSIINVLFILLVLYFPSLLYFLPFVFLYSLWNFRKVLKKWKE